MVVLSNIKMFNATSVLGFNLALQKSSDNVVLSHRPQAGADDAAKPIANEAVEMKLLKVILVGMSNNSLRKFNDEIYCQSNLYQDQQQKYHILKTLIISKMYQLKITRLLNKEWKKELMYQFTLE